MATGMPQVNEAIDASCTEAQEDSKRSSFIRNQSRRHLKAEDSDWAVCPVSYLANLCIKFIATHFIEIGIRKVKNAVKNADWKEIVDQLPLDLPEEITLPSLDDEEYWKRRGDTHWDVWDHYDGNWRKQYAEYRVAEEIENFVPYCSDITQLDKVTKIGKNFVTRLHIRHLHLEIIPTDADSGGKDDEEIYTPIPYRRPSHMDVGRILLRFPRLEEVVLSLAPRDCGLNYVYTDFEWTYRDGQMLTESLKKIPLLKLFKLYGSNVKTVLVKQISNAFMDHTSLTSLDLSYNLLKAESCLPISSLLMNTPVLEELILSYNCIGNDGAKYLGAALIKNKTLKSLILKLNGIEDDGGEFLAKCLMRNCTLQHCDVSGNKLEEKSGYAFADLIEVSGILKHINLSSNSLGKAAGAQLRDAVHKNSTLKEFDVRLCDIGDDFEIEIRDKVFENSEQDPFEVLKREMIRKGIL